jgi:adenylate cyclase class 2
MVEGMFLSKITWYNLIYMDNKEIEVRFLEIGQEQLMQKLKDLGAENHGEDFLEEVIFYDKDLTWKDKFVRLRKNAEGILLTYKHHKAETLDGVEEIEFKVSDFNKAEIFLERLGVSAYRHQQKKRHSFKLDEVVFDIDTWPHIPTYVELEGPSEEALKEAAEKTGLDWKDVVFENARTVIENKYHIPVGTMKWFTFDRFE